jgi:putative transposase
MFRYKLYRSKHNGRLHRLINIGGAIHNHVIALHKRYYRLYKKHLSHYKLKAHLAKLKRLPKYAWWKQLRAQVIQNIVDRIDKGYERFFQSLRDRKAGKATQRVGSPTFRKIAKAKSFTMTQDGWKLLGANRIQIHGTVYKFAKSRDIEGTIKTVTVKRDALGELYIYFSCLLDAQPIDRTMTGQSAGFDFGLTTYLTGNDGTEIQAPQPFKRRLKQIAQANRRLSRKAKNSHNRKKAQQHLARVHRRVVHVREAFHWHLARDLCQRYDHIALETLNLRSMQALWGRKISDLGFAGFVCILHHVASKLGSVVHHIDLWFPSTKLCSICGVLNEHITLRDRAWTCDACGTTHRRDQNAATNIYREGASSRGEECIRLPMAAALVDPRISRL